MRAISRCAAARMSASGDKVSSQLKKTARGSCPLERGFGCSTRVGKRRMLLLFGWCVGCCVDMVLTPYSDTQMAERLRGVSGVSQKATARTIARRDLSEWFQAGFRA